MCQKLFSLTLTTGWFDTLKFIKIKVLVKYTLSLLLAGGLLWYVYRDIDLASMVDRLRFIDYRWYIASVFVSLLSHLTRAYRWNILLEPFGFKLSSFRTFLAVMVGYFANLLIPRMGEITRCGVLKKIDDVPVTTSLGTVVTERLVDALSLFSLITLTLILEFDRLSPVFFGFFRDTFSGYELSSHFITFGTIALAGVVLLAVYMFKRFDLKHKIRKISFYQKVVTLFSELVAGIFSIRRIRRKAGFIISTVLIWVLYYLMSYVVFFSMEQTSGLGFMAGLSILIMGGIGMSAPVQGGIGTFHILVSSTLFLYGVSEEDGILFATVLHTSQVLMVILTGSICFVISLFISKKDSKTTIQNA